jgi:hypothetical protein
VHGPDAGGVQQQEGRQQAAPPVKRHQQRHLQARIAVPVQPAHEPRDLAAAGEQARAAGGLALRCGLGGHA